MRDADRTLAQLGLVDGSLQILPWLVAEYQIAIAEPLPADGPTLIVSNLVSRSSGPLTWA
jgi:hypothetical protein